MDAKTVREIFKNLPPKRKQVLLRVLADDSKQKIACELCDGSEDAVQQNLRQLYKNFHIDGDRERKQPALIKLFARCMPELLGDRIPDALDGVEQEEAITKPHQESVETIDTSASDLMSEWYGNLERLLIDKQWREANYATEVLIREVTNREEGLLCKEHIEKFPCEDLGKIDQLWTQYSNGRFGFNVQKRIWKRVWGTSTYDAEGERRLIECLGWYQDYYDLTVTPEKALEGCLPTHGWLAPHSGQHLFSRCEACKV